MLRRSLALSLLCVHAAAAAHLALASHVTADSGAAVEAQPQCAQGSHGSAGIGHGHELQREELECQAFALARTAARVATPVCLSNATPPAVAETSERREASPPVAVLSVAPKSSPPV